MSDKGLSEATSQASHVRTWRKAGVDFALDAAPLVIYVAELQLAEGRKGTAAGMKQ